VERVLIVDDDPRIRRALATALRSHGYEPLIAPNGETALDVLINESVDVVVLDLGLPGIDGQEVIKRLRSWSDVPVVVLSVRDAQRDKVTALDAGADDFVVKPFAIGELMARLRAVGRRSRTQEGETTLHYGPLELDLSRQLATQDGRPLHLTPTEHRLLFTMATNPGKLLTHSWLLSRVWGAGYTNDSHLLRVYVQQLRRKLDDDPGRPRHIITESGLGYRWVED
jgi:two-component system, OmpR family, KDP operon response regulator KdpE